MGRPRTAPAFDPRRSTAAPWLIVLDFDGTVTETDTDFFAGYRCLPEAQHPALDRLIRDYEATRIGLLDYFIGYLELIDVDSPAFRRAVSQTPIRHDLVALMIRAAESTPVVLVSEGLDIYINPIVERIGLTRFPLICNRVVRQAGAISILQADGGESCDRCLTCKGAFIRRVKGRNPHLRVALIGNGASDLCAAGESDAVFARDSLAELCETHRLAHTVWFDAEDIASTDIFKVIGGR